ncbi:RagB/SusD family nutrient uptake outer membrane protein [Maribellus maritimus]|uniref:RagB/SusD family nutrient uptake outer membrane protein n=1 Tax=Maribellus maritimus TaxID=2870838 RepID=UPI001EEAF997|nr:RagB/SusD family nutrient uptake outer membrane protein [Maribellus maritimus]MCG6190681.1 RagB/SusD family nutrient uptake outer membrane protein [Maribellus maritimus]
MKNYIVLFISILLLFSCEDFLDEKPTGTMTIDSELTSDESAQALANSAYVNSTVFYTSAGSWGGNTTLLLEYMTGKVTSENSQSNFNEFQNLIVSDRTLYLQEWWENCYSGISKCNLAIQKLSEFEDINEETINNYQAEVRFMRALYYFYLVRIFGDVPNIQSVQYELGELQVERKPVKEIYDEIIIPDLLFAEKSELPFVDNSGRTSIAAIKALLADVYLTYAGYPIQGGNEYYSESAKRSLEIIESGNFSLFNDYEALRNPANNNQGEFIFQVQFSLDKRHNDGVLLYLPSRSGISAFNLEYGSLIPSEKFVNSFEPNDKRAEEKQFFFSTYKGHPSKFSPGAPELDFMDLGAHYVYKFFDKNAIDVTAKSYLNWTIYRYADILLMYAEAQVLSDGQPNQTAFNSLNLIRNRANLSDFTDSNSDNFKKAVWDQRYFELCFENKMWFDMLRNRMIRDDESGEYINFVGYTNNWGKTYSETQLLFPIPLSEMQANSNLIQNSGY